MRSLRRFFTNRKNWLGIFLISVFLFVAIAAPLISPVDPKDPGPFKRVGRALDKIPYPPSSEALLGTLPGQFDILHSLVWGTRDALRFGLFVALGSSLIGILFGVIAGYAGGRVNSWMMRFADAFLTFPPLAGVVFLQQMVDITKGALIGNEYYDFLSIGVVRFDYEVSSPLLDFLSKVDPLLLILILFSWMPYARLVNSMVLTLIQADYIQATRSLGGSPFWIIRKHLIPNSISPAIVLAARDVGSAVIIQATFTFIGLGGDSPWGTMLSMGRDWIIGSNGNIFSYWWAYLPATIMVVVFGIAWNLLGDGINDALDPNSFSRIHKPLRAGRKSARKTDTDRSLKTPFVEKKPGSDPVLLIARSAVTRGDFDGAFHAYQHLIRRRRELNPVIYDLARLTQKSPGEAQYWQILGDALAQNGELVDASHAYEQANLVGR